MSDTAKVLNMTEYRHTRDPDPAWQTELEQLAPRIGESNWLKIHWFAGWDYEPIQRWRIFEMIPKLEVVPWEIREDLKGLSPRHPDNGKWITPGYQVLQEEQDIRRWYSWSSVDFDQWTLFQETGCFAVPVWIIQGDKGGHRWRLSQSEIGVLEDHGISSPELPLPGDLPYAEYDRRTFTQLAEFDKLRKWNMNTSWDDRGMTKTVAGLWVRGERQAAEEEYNKRLMKHLESHIENAVGEMSRAALPGMSDLPPGDREYNRDEDAEDQAFVEETATSLEI